MKTRFAAALLATACAIPGATLAAARDGAEDLQAQAQTPARPVRYTARQFFETTSYAMAASDGIAFSRDGRNLLINSDRSGVFNAFALPVAGGDPVQISQSTTNATFAVSYFPNDDRILFTSDQGGNELNHVYVRLPDGTVRDLTPGENLKANFAGWSADGRTFFVGTNEREPRAFDVYAYDATTYERRLIFRNSGEFLPGEVSRDGRYISLNKAKRDRDRLCRWPAQISAQSLEIPGRAGRDRSRFLRRFRLPEPDLRGTGRADVRPGAEKDDRRLRGARSGPLRGG